MSEVLLRKGQYKNGQHSYEIPYVNRRKHGIEKWYYDNGQPRCEIPWTNGQLHGIVKYYYEDGQPKAVRYYWRGTEITKEEWDNIPRLTKLLNGTNE